MKALVYLVGARHLDLELDRDGRRRRRLEEPLGPLATTAETAAAWRRWSHEPVAPGVMSGERQPRPSEAQRRPTSA